jgi:hypothetical protein
MAKAKKKHISFPLVPLPNIINKTDYGKGDMYMTFFFGKFSPN